MRLSNSKLKTWRRCPKKFEFKYIMGLEPKQRGIALQRGSWIHDLLQHYYDGEDWKERHRELTKEFYNLFEEERELLGDMPEECLRIMRAYLYRYKSEDEDLIVVDSELNEIVTLDDGTEFNFIIDLIIEEDKGYWLWDHKTVKNFMSPNFMLLDAQLARYFRCAEMLGYTPLRGVLFNELRTKPPAIPELLKSGRLTERKNIDTDLYTYTKAIRNAGHSQGHYRATLDRLARQPDKFFRRTRIPKDKALTDRLMLELSMGANEIERATAENEFPRSAEKTCEWDCEFLNLCQVQLMGGDISSMIKQDFRVRKGRPQNVQ